MDPRTVRSRRRGNGSGGLLKAVQRDIQQDRLMTRPVEYLLRGGEPPTRLDTPGVSHRPIMSLAGNDPSRASR